MRRFLLLCLVSALSHSVSHALPRFALWRGEANCLSCHTNPTGGGIRNSGGEGYSKNVLAMWKRGGEFSGQISEGIRIGANIRSQFLSFSQSGPLDMPGDTTVTSSTSHAMTAALMVDASLTNALHAYVRWDPLNNYNEMYGTLHFVDQSGEILESGAVVTHAYLKTGAFLPAFGVRFEDHTLYSRGGNRGISQFGGAGLFWIDGYRDVGLEAGATFFDHVGLQIGYLNGSEQVPTANRATFGNNTRAISLRATASAELADDMLAFEAGGSLYMHPNDVATKDLSLAGVHIGVRGGPVTVLAEYDFGDNVYQPWQGTYLPKVTALTAEATVRVTQGLELIGRFETYKDQVQDTAQRLTDGNIVDSRITIGVQWFPVRFLEVRPEFRIAKFSTIEGSGVRNKYDQTTIILQTHFYF